VFGFAVGPLIWAPLSEMYGRQILFFVTFACFTVFNAGVPGSKNIATVIILRFVAGTFGSSPLTNAGGVVADMFPARQRGLAMSVFATAPFLGPAIGPIVGGFLGKSSGWKWLTGFLAAFSGFCWMLGTVAVPETYGPVLLRRRAEALSKKTGKVYRSKIDVDKSVIGLGDAFKTTLSRPWILLMREPIVLILCSYIAIIYGTLYMMFAAYPIVYQEGRGWSEGIGGLAFIGVLIGMLAAVTYSIYLVNPRYQKAVDKYGGFAPPEARLPAAMLGGICLPIGLFWFAWTNSPTLPWAASIAAGIPFGFGMVLVFLSITNYLVDSYTIFAASVLAANSILRSTFGAAFPLFTTQMYARLGIHWASSVPAFLALACVPFPFLFYKYGAAVRKKCKFAAESEAFMAKLQNQQDDPLLDTPSDDDQEKNTEISVEKKEHQRRMEEHEAEHEAEAVCCSYEEPEEAGGRLEKMETNRSHNRTRTNTEYDLNPYDIDRVNTRESFMKPKSQDGGALSKQSSGRSGRSRE
jgi:multidrug resistance protein